MQQLLASLFVKVQVKLRYECCASRKPVLLSGILMTGLVDVNVEPLLGWNLRAFDTPLTPRGRSLL